MKQPRSEAAETFLEELIVRRELAENFCFYNENYDSIKGFPAWSQKTLAEHSRDKRPYLYSEATLDKAQTHDELWNAAQLELVHCGTMPGYLRMYWAKKILEWSPSATIAMRVAVGLNDRYQVDGRDPNGYAGIAWSIGGVHDRPWFPRPIFGTVRFMARSGCDRRFSVSTYSAAVHQRLGNVNS
jgi:deoxyribodipyrimidine photo-lyase